MAFRLKQLLYAKEFMSTAGTLMIAGTVYVMHSRPDRRLVRAQTGATPPVIHHGAPKASATAASGWPSGWALLSAGD